METRTTIESAGYLHRVPQRDMRASLAAAFKRQHGLGAHAGRSIPKAQVGTANRCVVGSALSCVMAVSACAPNLLFSNIQLYVAQPFHLFRITVIEKTACLLVQSLNRLQIFGAEVKIEDVEILNDSFLTRAASRTCGRQKAISYQSLLRFGMGTLWRDLQVKTALSRLPARCSRSSLASNRTCALLTGALPVERACRVDAAAGIKNRVGPSLHRCVRTSTVRVLMRKCRLANRFASLAYCVRTSR